MSKLKYSYFVTIKSYANRNNFFNSLTYGGGGLFSASLSDSLVYVECNVLFSFIIVGNSTDVIHIIPGKECNSVQVKKPLVFSVFLSAFALRILVLWLTDISLESAVYKCRPFNVQVSPMREEESGFKVLVACLLSTLMVLFIDVLIVLINPLFMNQLFTNIVVALAGVPDEGGGIRLQRTGSQPARRPRCAVH